MSTENQTLDSHNVLPNRQEACVLGCLCYTCEQCAEDGSKLDQRNHGEKRVVLSQLIDWITLPSTSPQQCVGAEGTGKHDLSLAVLQLPVQFSLQIRVASSLPLPEENAATRPRIDYICFMLNMADRDSIQVVEKSLSLVDVRYFLGRACLVVSGACSHRKMTDVEQMTALADAYHLPLVFGEVKDQKDRDQLAHRILSMVEIAAGFKRRISPSLIESTRAFSN